MVGNQYLQKNATNFSSMKNIRHCNYNRILHKMLKHFWLKLCIREMKNLSYWQLHTNFDTMIRLRKTEHGTKLEVCLQYLNMQKEDFNDSHKETFVPLLLFSMSSTQKMNIWNEPHFYRWFFFHRKIINAIFESS